MHTGITVLKAQTQGKSWYKGRESNDMIRNSEFRQISLGFLPVKDLGRNVKICSPLARSEENFAIFVHERTGKKKKKGKDRLLLGNTGKFWSLPFASTAQSLAKFLTGRFFSTPGVGIQILESKFL